MTTEHTLYEGVLNNDHITLCDDGSALLTYYTYATEWSNNVIEKAFNTLDDAVRYYKRKFHDRVFEQGKRWIEEDKEYSYIADTPEIYWKEVVYEQGMVI